MVESFWPDGIAVDDTRSPRRILDEANEEWQEMSGRRLGLVVHDTTSQNGFRMLLVHAMDFESDRSMSLFSVLHRPGRAYPARIQFDSSEDVPNFLRKEYYEPSLGALHDLSLSKIARGKHVKNKWVAETPNEFRSLLVSAMNLDHIKTGLVNLLSDELIGLSDDAEGVADDAVTDSQQLDDAENEGESESE